MSQEIFRKSSLDRVSSPEKLNDYIKVSNPAIWLVILALFVLLIVGAIWASVGTLPTKVRTLGGVFIGNESSSSPEYVRCFVLESNLIGDNDDTNTSGEEKSIVKIGQTAEILPVGKNSKSDEYIKGKVKDINGVPLSLDDENTQMSPELQKKLKQISGGRELFEVDIEVDKSSKNNNPTGSYCGVNILTKDEKILNFLSN
ncbi:MAG: hypothetical protein LBI55_00300 [Oscillospiraceae bacterium]|jgi:hypothetical protein|nr:hypothetical protein [Oscillospiraceae bacterium]